MKLLIQTDQKDLMKVLWWQKWLANHTRSSNPGTCSTLHQPEDDYCICWKGCLALFCGPKSFAYIPPWYANEFSPLVLTGFKSRSPFLFSTSPGFTPFSAYLNGEKMLAIKNLCFASWIRSRFFTLLAIIWQLKRDYQLNNAIHLNKNITLMAVKVGTTRSRENELTQADSISSLLWNDFQSTKTFSFLQQKFNSHSDMVQQGCNYSSA